MKARELIRFNRIISRFKKSRILVIGDMMLDKFIWGTVSRISPEAPVPVVWVKSESSMPGGAANVANNICAFGARAYMCGVVGDDEAGRSIASELAKNGINSEGIFVDSSRPTIDKTRIIAHHQQVVRIDRELNTALSSGMIERILSFARSKINEVDAIIIEDYDKGLIVPGLIKGLLKIAKSHGKIITVDPKQDHFNLYKGVTVITPNRKEAQEGSNIKIEDVSSLKKAGSALLKKLSCESVLITLGEDGMALFKRNGSLVHIPTVAQEVYDVSGAGDTVIATFTLAKSCGASMAEAAYISNVAAGIVVGKLGIATCNASELKSHLGQINLNGIKGKKSSYPSESIFAN